MKPERSAFPYKLNDVTTYQWIDSGLTRMEYFALHLMAASVTANDHSRPDWLTPDIAKAHAKSAVMLARALAEELENEKGR